MQTVINNEPVIIVLLDSFGKYTRVADAKRIKTWMEKEAKINKVTNLKNSTKQPS